MNDKPPAVRIAIALTVGVFLFYLVTLAPTVLWGDDAFFQWSAEARYLQADGGGHWLHFQLSRLFLHLPVGDIAYRVNLVSAVFGTLTILLVFLTGLSLKLSNMGAAAGALSLTVAHTFWTHAVRAEVYTVFTFMLALLIWLLVSWSKERPAFLFAAVFLIGPTLLSHQMALLILPALVLLFWFRRSWMQPRIWLMLFGIFVLGLALAGVVIQAQVGAERVFKSLGIYFTQSGTDFRGAIVDISLSQLPADLAYWLGMLGLQFVGPGFLLGVLGFYKWRKISAIWWVLILFYFTTVLFAATYRVNDRYVFFLPGYLVFAWLVGRGWDALGEIRPSLTKIALPLLIFFPILTYGLLPPLMQTAGVSLPGARILPGREPVSYFLWPAKNGYMAAAEFGRSTLLELPPDAVLLADHTPYETLNYIQQVVGLRPDVHLIKIEPEQDLAAILNNFQDNQSIFLADNNPRYYNLASLPETTLVRNGTVYRLENE